MRHATPDPSEYWNQAAIELEPHDIVGSPARESLSARRRQVPTNPKGGL